MKVFSQMFSQYCDNTFSDRGLRQIFYHDRELARKFQLLYKSPMNVIWFMVYYSFDTRFMGFCIEICKQTMNDEQFEKIIKIQYTLIRVPHYCSCCECMLNFYKKNKKNRRKRQKIRRSRRRFQRRLKINEKKKESRPNDYIVIRRSKMCNAIYYYEHQIYKHILSDPTIIKQLTKLERLISECVKFVKHDSTPFISKCVLKYLEHFIQCDVITDVCAQYLFVFCYKKTYL
jgi:hypothetical protein